MLLATLKGVGLGTFCGEPTGVSFAAEMSGVTDVVVVLGWKTADALAAENRGRLSRERGNEDGDEETAAVGGRTITPGE